MQVSFPRWSMFSPLTAKLIPRFSAKFFVFNRPFDYGLAMAPTEAVTGTENVETGLVVGIAKARNLMKAAKKFGFAT